MNGRDRERETVCVGGAVCEKARVRETEREREVLIMQYKLLIGEIADESSIGVID